MKKRILIIYATYGNGHKAIAGYIERYFKNRNENLEIKSIDLLDYCLSKKGRIGQKVSEYLMLHIPFVWDIIYKTSDHKITSNFSSNIITKPFRNKKLENEIINFNPDLTISTHFYGSSIIADYNKKKMINSKLISIVTDYEAHELWLKDFDDTNYLVVCSKDEQRLLVSEGYKKSKIKPFGIPIFPNLLEKSNKEEYIAKLGLNPQNLTCVCFAGGGSGSTATIPYVKNLIKNNSINLIIISGRNKKVYNKAKSYISKYDAKNVIVYGYITNVPEILESCDFVVTKPGGAQTTECLYFRKPMLLIRSSGGQENANIKFFTRHGYAKRFRTPLKLARYYKSINKSDLERMKNKLSKSDSRGSIKKIYELSLKTLRER